MGDGNILRRAEFWCNLAAITGDILAILAGRAKMIPYPIDVAIIFAITVIIIAGDYKLDTCRTVN